VLLLQAGCATPQNHITERAECFWEREFLVSSTAPGIDIAGSIMAPRGSTRAAVLMITGAGPHTREQRISNTPIYTMIAEHLARRGMVVARSDARGFGASTGPADDEAYNTADRAADNRAVLAFLRTQPEFAHAPLGLLGQSEGAMIAVMIAADDPSVAFNVLLAPSVLPGAEVMGDQYEGNLVRRGATPEAAAAVREQTIRFGHFLAAGGQRGPEFAAIAHDFLAAHGVEEAENAPEFAQGLISGYLDSAHYRFFAGYDPRADLTRVTQPTIAIFAGEDHNVRSDRHLPAFHAAMQLANNADAAALLIPDQDHFFLEHDGARVDRHVPGEMQVADELYAALDAELNRRGWLAQDACVDP
jgi:alpha-beta hydrolase superfamily lysophospholipase